jgi:hypothetical protein
MAERLAVGEHEIESLIDLCRSRLDVSLRTIMHSTAA